MLKLISSFLLSILFVSGEKWPPSEGVGIRAGLFANLPARSVTTDAAELDSWRRDPPCEFPNNAASSTRRRPRRCAEEREDDELSSRRAPARAAAELVGELPPLPLPVGSVRHLAFMDAMKSSKIASERASGFRCSETELAGLHVRHAIAMAQRATAGPEFGALSLADWATEEEAAAEEDGDEQELASSGGGTSPSRGEEEENSDDNEPTRPPMSPFVSPSPSPVGGRLSPRVLLRRLSVSDLARDGVRVDEPLSAGSLPLFKCL